MWEKISENIHFMSIPYKTPSFLKEEEMFYRRTHLSYVKQGFPKRRKGYLHMCHFYNNLYKYPETKLHEHDYIMSIDDESLFLKEVPYNFFEVMSKREEFAGALKVTNSKNKPPRQGNLDTRVGMKNFIVNYIKEHKIQPKCKFIEDALLEKDEERLFHNEITYADSYVFKTSLFKTSEWQQWNDAVNKSGGIYKYRWGDHELNSLFFMIHYGEPVYDFKTVDEGYHDQGGLRNIQDMAPGIKDAHK